MRNNKILMVLVMCAISSLGSSSFLHSTTRPLVLAQEEITPLSYPKFNVTFNYNYGRRFHGFDHPDLRFGLGAVDMGVNLAFETGLYKYFNAGAQLSFGIPRSLEEPLHLGLGLFAKPYFPIGDRCSIFSLAGAGLSAAQNSMKTWLSERHEQEIERVYLYSDYYNTAFGGNVYLSVGIEYFPWPLLGFAFAGGVRAELWRERGLKTQKKAPDDFSYATYEFPIGLMLQVIL